MTKLSLILLAATVITARADVTPVTPGAGEVEGIYVRYGQRDDRPLAAVRVFTEYGALNVDLWKAGLVRRVLRTWLLHGRPMQGQKTLELSGATSSGYRVTFFANGSRVTPVIRLDTAEEAFLTAIRRDSFTDAFAAAGDALAKEGRSFTEFVTGAYVKDVTDMPPPLDPCEINLVKVDR